MRRSSGGAASGAARTAAFLFTLAAPLLLYLVVRTALVGLTPAIGASLPPHDYRSPARRAVIASAHPKFVMKPEVLQVGRQAAESSPLLFEPFFLAARAAEQKGRLGEATKLMEEARRRRPNFLLNRLHLIAYYIQARRYERLVPEVDYALRVSEETRRGLLPELVKLAGDRDARPYLADLLAANPAWKSDFFNVARDQMKRPEDALALLQLAQARRVDASAERALYLHALIRTGQHAKARATWLASLPAAERDRHRLLFDGGFTGSKAGGEFGWTLHNRDVGSAQIVSSGSERPHLDVSYFGGGSAVLAEQRLALPPGRFRLAFATQSEADLPSGQFLWIVSCVSDGPELARVAPTVAGRQYRPVAAQFTVPSSGCSGQTLRLLAEPGEISALTEVRFSGMEITNAK